MPLAIGVVAGIVLTQFTPVGEWVWNLLYSWGAPMIAAGTATAVVIIGVCVGLSLLVFSLLRRQRPEQTREGAGDA